MNKEKFPYLNRSQKRSVLFLIFANCLLIGVGWAMALMAYPRLPGEIVLWLNFFGQGVLKTEKTHLFFIYPFMQTLFVSGFWLLAGRIISKRVPEKKEKACADGGKRVFFMRLEKELVTLVLIFFNLIFIHVQTSLILLSHEIGGGINRFYFVGIIGVILILIPYYRIRRRLMK